ncbi:SDR family NAD(P)-dependent oxidoreductase, partial [Bacillus thuringiensis]|nr:SDR family NAD(P)-dependent oxidoreductase [Bacillus thuringiensis]
VKPVTGEQIADIADEASVRQAFAQAEAELGPVLVLVNNAGQAVSQRFDRTDAALWQSMLAVNLTGTFHCIQAALPGMLAAKWG